MNLILRNISKRYKNVWAVKNFNAEFANGIYGLLGPNGSGKTTLMKIIVDILKPTSGEVLADGENIHTMDERYRDILGYLPQQFGLYKNFTARMFLMYISALKGLDKKMSESKVDEELELVNLSKEGRKKIGTFSGGMKQRLGIAQTLLNDPEIIVLDEPTAGLDPNERVRFRNLLSRISEDRIIILSTHIVSDIEYIANSVLLLKKGELIKSGTPDNLLNEVSGKVWSAVVSSNAVDEIKSKKRIISLARKNDGVEVRIISDEKPLPDAKIESPRFEDVYLYNFEDSGSDTYDTFKM